MGLRSRIWSLSFIIIPEARKSDCSMQNIASALWKKVNVTLPWYGEHTCRVVIASDLELGE